MVAIVDFDKIDAHSTIRMPIERTRRCPSGNNMFQLRGMCFNSALEQASKSSNAPGMSAMEKWVNESALSANPNPKNAFVIPVYSVSFPFFSRFNIASLREPWAAFEQTP
jgi:hypothetical protein